MDHLLIGKTSLTLTQGDLTQQAVDALVNAANAALAGGGGVDGAIHRGGGPSILEECRAIGGCPTGEAVITGAGELPARHVIHAVGPIWRGGHAGEYVLLERAWSSSLTLAAKHGLRRVAFPSISTGAYGFPIERAALVALGTVARFCDEQPEALDEVRVVLFSHADLAVYQRALDQLARTMRG
jgi:O-acetyl-ADP-ribose deacetylase (regulator of RNase III)